MRLEDDDLVDLVLVEPDQDAAGGPNELHAAAAPVERAGVAVDPADLLGRHVEGHTAGSGALEALLEAQLDGLVFVVQQAVETGLGNRTPMTSSA